MESLEDPTIGNRNEGVDKLALLDDKQHELAAFVMLEAQIVQLGEVA